MRPAYRNAHSSLWRTTSFAQGTQMINVTLAWINAPARIHDIPAYCLEYNAQERNSYTHQNGVEI
jgi:hypothetical protein